MLVASKSGNISAAKLIRETDRSWVVMIEGREISINKSDSRQRVFSEMAEALEWAGAEPDLIEHFQANRGNQMDKCFKVVPHPKLKRDYKGKRVRTLRDLRNGLGVIRAGSVGVIDYQGPKGSSLVIDACSCCGFRPTISQVQPDAIEFIEAKENG